MSVCLLLYQAKLTGLIELELVLRMGSMSNETLNIYHHFIFMTASNVRPQNAFILKFSSLLKTDKLVIS